MPRMERVAALRSALSVLEFHGPRYVGQWNCRSRGVIADSALRRQIARRGNLPDYQRQEGEPS